MERGRTLEDKAGSQTLSAGDEARNLLQQKRPADAARVLRRHLSSQNGTAADHMLLGVALAQSGEGLAAIQSLEQAVAMEPENAAAHYNLGQLYRQGGRHRDALASLERALQLRPDYPAAARAAEELRRLAAGPSPQETAAPVSSAAPGAPAAT